jgi:hypothetical protein
MGYYGVGGAHHAYDIHMHAVRITYAYIRMMCIMVIHHVHGIRVFTPLLHEMW